MKLFADPSLVELFCHFDPFEESSLDAGGLQPLENRWVPGVLSLEDDVPFHFSFRLLMLRVPCELPQK